MANTGFKGIDVRQTGAELVFRALLQNSGGGLVTSGATNLYLWELQSDGSIKTYDFSNNTFSSGSVTTEAQAMTYRKSNNGATDTGFWTVALSTLTGFTVGAVYMARINNTGAFPTDQVREFQYGSEQGDIAVVASGTPGLGYTGIDQTQALLTAPGANSVGESLYFADLLGGRVGVAQAGTSTSITLDAAASGDTNAYVGDDVHLSAGTGGGPRGSGQRRTITAYNPSTKVATVNRAWDTTPDATTKFMTLPQAVANVGLWSYATVATPSLAGVPVTDPHYWSGTGFPTVTNPGVPDVNTTSWAGQTAMVDSENFPRVSGPFKRNTANGFAFAMVQSTDHTTPYTGGGVSGARTIAGGTLAAVSGLIVQVGSTNLYYFNGAAADFNGTSIAFMFTAAGADAVVYNINTTP